MVFEVKNGLIRVNEKLNTSFLNTLYFIFALMNRTKFTGLIAMMLLSILGIIWVQVVWIRNAITIQNEGFNNAVSMSLMNAANTIETYRRMNFFNNLMPDNPLIFNDSSTDIDGFLSIGNYSSGDKLSISITNQSLEGGPDTGKITTVNKSYTIRNDNTIVEDSSTYTVSAADQPGKMNIVRDQYGDRSEFKGCYISSKTNFLTGSKKDPANFRI